MPTIATNMDTKKLKGEFFKPIIVNITFRQLLMMLGSLMKFRLVKKKADRYDFSIIPSDQKCW